MSKKIWNKLFKSKSPKTLKSPAVSDNKKHKRFSIYEEYQQLNVTENQEKQLPKLKIHEIEKTPTEDELPCTATVAASMHNNAAPTKTQTTLSKVVNSLTLKRYSKDRSKDSSSSLGNRNSNGSETSYKQMNAVNRQTATTQNNNNDNNTNNTHSSINNNIIDISEEPDSKISLKLIPCPICSRTFNPVTLQKHVKICEKMATKKRNVFDSSRQRREGTELASYPSPTNYNVPLVSHAQPPKLMQTPSPVLSRKKPIEELSRKSIRASVRKHSSLTPNAPQSAPTGTIITATPETSNAAVTSNFRRDRMRSSERSLSKRTQPPVAEQCPYCERCFGVKAYDRHVEWCKEKALQASIKLSTKNEQNVAKERLEARTKYRAPCLKTKRSINRDKYASLTGDENESTDSPKSGNSAYKNNNMSSNNIMSLSLTSSIMSETTTPHHGTSNAVHNSRNSSNHSNDNNKTGYFVEKTLPSRPNANKNEHQIRRSTEREVPDFRLNGESCETPSNKMKKDRLAIDQAADLNNVAVNESSVVGPRSLTRVGTSSFNNSQDNRVEIQTHIGNNLLGTSTPTNTSTAPSLLTKSLSSLSRRKLKAKEHSATNLSISKHGPTLDDVNSAAVNSQIVNTKEPKIKKLHPSISLPHLEQQQEQQQESSIFGLTQNTKLKTTVSTTALSVHAKLETNPIKGPIICRPKRKKLQRQQNATSAPLKAIPLLKESIETFGLATKNKVILDKRKEINIIKAPGLTTNLNTAPTLLRNRSFILRTKSPLESLEYNHNETFTNYDEPKSAHSRPDFDFDEVDKKKREIFISIETEQNDQGRSTISPDSLRSIVGDNQNPHVEEVPANDNKFSKIEDDDDRMPISSTSRSYFEANQLPNIQLNNAKNLIQKMQDSFRQMGEEAGTSIRQAVLNSTPRSSTASNSFFDNIRSPLSTERSEVAENVGSPVDGDSDEASSLESYPVSSQSSRRGVASKLSADSAYGSLSRQRSSEFANLNRHQIRSRPSTSSCGTNTALVTPMIDAATQHQPQKLQQKPQNIKNTTKRSLSRQFSADSSSGSDISLPPLVEKMSDHLSKNLQDHQGMSGYEQKSQQQIYENTSNDYTYHNKSLIQPTAPIKTDTTSTIEEGTSQAVRTSLSRLTPASCSSNSINSSSMTSSMKISRFCHECGSRFLIDEAKFCMDCGVKRLIL